MVGENCRFKIWPKSFTEMTKLRVDSRQRCCISLVLQMGDDIDINSSHRLVWDCQSSPCRVTPLEQPMCALLITTVTQCPVYHNTLGITRSSVSQRVVLYFNLVDHMWKSVTSIWWTKCENQFRIAFWNYPEVMPALKMYMSGLVLPMYLKLPDRYYIST